MFRIRVDKRGRGCCGEAEGNERESNTTRDHATSNVVGVHSHTVRTRDSTRCEPGQSDQQPALSSAFAFASGDAHQPGKAARPSAHTTRYSTLTRLQRSSGPASGTPALEAR
jgi:hypothetical protein